MACYFPLGSNERSHAARRASEIYRTVVARGWTSTFLNHSREITFAIFWRRHPIVCTYTTLYTDPRARPPSPRPARPDSRRVVLIEDDPKILATLEEWVSTCPDIRLGGAFRNARSALRSRALTNADVCLFTQHPQDMSEQDLIHRLASLPRPVPAFAFGIFEVSDDIFASLSGVQEGYYLRRRPPLGMLDPIQTVTRRSTPSRHDMDSHINSYFLGILDRTNSEMTSPQPSILTSRELEVLDCVRKGYPDKQIAQALSIQPSTVHTHLKKMFEKLGVHTRTEAVMKHLQK